jgi:hypothetical protein
LRLVFSHFVRPIDSQSGRMLRRRNRGMTVCPSRALDLQRRGDASDASALDRGGGWPAASIVDAA